MSGEPEIIGGFGLVLPGLFATPERHNDFDEEDVELLAAGVEIVTFGGPDGSDAFLVIAVTKKLVAPWGHHEQSWNECFAQLGTDDYPLSVINEWRSRFQPLCSKLGIPFVPENIGWFMCLSWEGT